MMLDYYEGAAWDELMPRKNSAGCDRSKFCHPWSLQDSPIAT